jgi:predicted Zn-ribbon and HTH transcriptional regulator
MSKALSSEAWAVIRHFAKCEQLLTRVDIHPFTDLSFNPPTLPDRPGALHSSPSKTEKSLKLLAFCKNTPAFLIWLADCLFSKRPSRKLQTLLGLSRSINNSRIFSKDQRIFHQKSALTLPPPCRCWCGWKDTGETVLWPSLRPKCKEKLYVQSWLTGA